MNKRSARRPQTVNIGYHEAMRKPTEEILRLKRLSDNGAAVAHAADGVVVFVSDGAPGDLARVTYERTHGSYRTGRICELLEPSPARVQPPCPFVAECGGCAWQHVAYPTQLEAKRQIVVDALQRIAGLDAGRAAELVGAARSSPREYHYRNKLVLGARNDEREGLQLGFRRRATQTIVGPDSCLLAHRAIAGAPKALRGALRFAQGNRDLGLFSVSVRHSEHSGQTEVALWTEAGAFERARIASVVASALKTTGIVRVIASRREPRTIRQVELLSGFGAWKERLTGLEYLTSAPAFFQINSATAELLISQVLSGLKPATGSRVADLYAGGGTFALPLARAGCEVNAVEDFGPSVRDLRRNAERNGLEVAVHGGDAGRILGELGTLDALVVNPPRAGLRAAALAAVVAAAPRRLAYVSCNPATWARDVARLAEQGYALRGVQPIDQFPQTPHIELVSVLEHAQGCGKMGGCGAAGGGAVATVGGGGGGAAADSGNGGGAVATDSGTGGGAAATDSGTGAAGGAAPGL
ncbi:MAG: 23S rRNA (uracil(1939)-C(5))-methyltransferase RlmD [Coriobacteriales bacterium]|jgi:23S rRNA (uracil1939-C5)-methyltransferase|nr:23S rRNA (uracil(1939)-C(5))-methyltransferase RlmD [Coriobacteriales bacterium]